MAGWKKAMLYLGLGPDEEYDQFDDGFGHDSQRPGPQPAAAPRTVTPIAPMPSAHDSNQRPIRVLPMEQSERNAGRGTADLPSHTQPTGAIGAIQPMPQSAAAPRATSGFEGSTVRAVPMSSSVKPHAISPTSFNDAQAVADRFLVKQPVIVNLQGADRDLARRLIDFASGLCYGVGGQMERVANQVYLLTPTDTEVSPEDRERLTQGKYQS